MYVVTLQRVHKFIEVGGGIFENLLWDVPECAELFVVVFVSKPQLIVIFVYGNHKDRSLQMKPLHTWTDWKYP